MLSNNPLGKLIKCIFLLSFFVTINSCASHYHFPTSFEIPPSEKKEVIPLTIGLYLKPQFKNYVAVGTPPLNIVVNLEDALGRSAEKMSKQIFSEVVTEQNGDFDFDSKSIDAVVTPELLQFKLYWIRKLTNVLHCEITIRWTIVDTHGKVFYVNTFTGEAIDEFQPYFLIWRLENLTNKCIAIAIKAQFREAQEGILATNWYEFR